MRTPWVTVAWLVLLAALCSAPPASLAQAPAPLAQADQGPVSAAPKASPWWTVPPAPKPGLFLGCVAEGPDKGKLLLLPDLPKGTPYQWEPWSKTSLRLTWVDQATGRAQHCDYTGTIAAALDFSVQPTPPPVPPPVPVPPVPVPPVPTALKVLVVYETAELPKMKPAQTAIILSAEVRKYLATHTAKEGEVPTFRFLDKDDPMDRESALWQRLMGQAKGKALPWLIIDGAYDGPLPESEAAILDLLRKWGGP